MEQLGSQLSTYLWVKCYLLRWRIKIWLKALQKTTKWTFSYDYVVKLLFPKSGSYSHSQLKNSWTTWKQTSHLQLKDKVKYLCSLSSCVNWKLINTATTSWLVIWLCKSAVSLKCNKATVPSSTWNVLKLPPWIKQWSALLQPQQKYSICLILTIFG